MDTSPDLSVIEIKAFVPSSDFELSKRFYLDVGFTMASNGGGVAYFSYNSASFLLQDFFPKDSAENFMMHLLVANVDAWWDRVKASGVEAKYGVKISKIENQPWKMREFSLSDPSGVLWRIGQNVN